ncbi:MAG: heparinase II/III family protein [Planctomycetota bacterium]|nr:heparinase II/III family protein [Planctomycetota bacterium]
MDDDRCSIHFQEAKQLRENRIRIFVVFCACFAMTGALLQAEESPSRAVWWLAQDNVKPIAELVNQAAPGAASQFQDRIADFSVTADGRALEITGTFPEPNIWRFDLTTFKGQFDMRKLYAKIANCAFPDPDSIHTKRLESFFGDKEKALTYTGPWEILGGKWLVPTARVALDGQHIYTSWFDLPSLEDQQVGRVYSSFALDIEKAGKHTIRVSFDDFVHHTRWRPPHWRKTKPEIEYSINDLRPHHIESIAIGIDERVRMLPEAPLKPEFRGKHPRLPNLNPVKGENLGIKDVENMLIHVDLDRGKLWEYSDDAESMASANDMDSGKHAVSCSMEYDSHVNHLSPEARKEWDRLFQNRFQQYYNFFVFQRNYHPTGYAQNHSSATIKGLLHAGMVWDNPEGEKWLRWGIMICRKRIEILGTDGGLEWMNESRAYGLGFFQDPIDFIRYSTGLDISDGQPFFENEWRYALHMSHAFPTSEDRRPVHLKVLEQNKGQRPQPNPNVPIPQGIKAEETPTNYHFEDVDQVYMRSDWSGQALRARLWAGNVHGKRAAIAKRYNWAHCQVNQGSFILSKGAAPIVLEPGSIRTYRKTAVNNNCIVVNDTDQWGGGQVWHPKLEPEQLSSIDYFADGKLLSYARANLKNAYPPEAKIRSLSRCLIHLKPDHFLVFDRLETEGNGKAEWRFHSAFINEQKPGRFLLSSYNRLQSIWSRNGGSKYEDHFAPNEEIQAEVALLTNSGATSIGMTDTYFRWSFFSLPQRHLKIVQQGASELILLTAFAPKLNLSGKDGIYSGRNEMVEWTVLVGAQETGGIKSDAFITVVAKAKDGSSEVLCFGGTELTIGGSKVERKTPDLFTQSGAKLN